MMIRSATLAIALTLAATAAMAEGEPQNLGQFGDWSANSYDGKDGKVCYIIAKPKASQPATAKRDPIWFIVTHRPKANVRNEVSTEIGYTFKADTPVALSIDGNAYSLSITKESSAWAADAAKDRQIVAALKKGNKLVVNGVSWRGTKTSDSYSLDSITAALDKIDEACQP